MPVPSKLRRFRRSECVIHAASTRMRGMPESLRLSFILDFLHEQVEVRDLDIVEFAEFCHRFCIGLLFAYASPSLQGLSTCKYDVLGAEVGALRHRGGLMIAYTQLCGIQKAGYELVEMVISFSLR